MNMTDPCIICVAITGSVPTKADNPAVPVTVSEQIESTHAAFEAGASICHAASYHRPCKSELRIAVRNGFGCTCDPISKK